MYHSHTVVFFLFVSDDNTYYLVKSTGLGSTKPAFTDYRYCYLLALFVSLIFLKILTN